MVEAEDEIVLERQKSTAEIKILRETEQDLRLKLQEAKKQCSAAHNSLAAMAYEKEKLIKENNELNSVCNELVTMIESEEK